MSIFWEFNGETEGMNQEWVLWVMQVCVKNLHNCMTPLASLFKHPNAMCNSIHEVHAVECGGISHSSGMFGPGSTFSAALLNWTRGRVIVEMQLGFKNMLANLREGYLRNSSLKGFSKSSTWFHSWWFDYLMSSVGLSEKWNRRAVWL